VTLGALLSSGALVGDALKSFLKRRLRIKPGETFFIFDQIDYILGALAFVSLKIPLSSLPVFTLILTWTAIHVLTTVIAWKAGIKEKAI
jgi:CDP-2,3-bis-(O-geranylgeranyl)-sn-glycerol synthase